MFVARTNIDALCPQKSYRHGWYLYSRPRIYKYGNAIGDNSEGRTKTLNGWRRARIAARDTFMHCRVEIRALTITLLINVAKQRKANLRSKAQHLKM